MLQRQMLAPGVHLSVMTTDKFKTGCFSVNFLRPHHAADAAMNALLPSVLLRGTQAYPDITAISARLDTLYGAGLGTLIRRKGEVSLVGLYADFIEDAFLPEGETVFAPMLELTEQVLFHPVTEAGIFCEKNVEGEKQNLINAIESSLNDKRNYAMAQMLSAMCRNEAYGVPRLGRVEDVTPITARSLWAHYQKVLQTSQIELFYAGRQAPETVAAAFGKLFQNHLPRELTPFGTARVLKAEQVQTVSESMDVTQGKLVLGLRTGITVEDADYPALLLLNAVLGAGISSKLYRNVRERLSLCYYAGSGLEKFKGIMTVSSGIAFADYEKAKAAILQEIEECRLGHITQEELEAARQMVAFALRVSMDSPAQLDELYTGMAVADMDDYATLLTKLSRLTAEQLAQAARKLTLDTVYFLKGEEE